MSAPNTLYLTSAEYLDDKMQAVLQFENSGKRIVRRFKFHPKLIVSLDDAAIGLFREIARENELTVFSVKRISQSAAEVCAPNFSILKKLNNILQKFFNARTVMPEPARQFLIERNWSFFQEFEFFSEGISSKEFASVPDSFLPFLSKTVFAELGAMLRRDSSVAERLVERIALSFALTVPFELVPKQQFLQLELFLEKIFFKNNFALPKHENLKSESRAAASNRNFFPADSTELSFTGIWPSIFSSDFLNLGFESINCACCAPDSFSAHNVLPSSLVEVEFLSSGFFFNSFSEKFAREFHEKNASKNERLSFQNEWSMQSIPLGPFNEGARAQLLLPDALELEGKGAIRILSGNALEWVCTKNESFLSREINSLNSKISLLRRSVEAMEKNASQGKTLFSLEQLSLDPDFFFKSKSLEAINSFLCIFPMHLLSPASRFFSEKIARALEAVQAETLFKFREFSKASGARCFSSSIFRAFVASDSALSLAQKFSREFALPAPAVVLRNRR
ncbi:MAG: hypothetical protein V1494_01925 [Candidatus Diapherotrites archaeon]